MSFVVAIKDEEGASAVEYAVLIALILVVIITSVGLLGGNTREGFNTVNSELSSVLPDDKQGKCKDSPDDADCGIGND